MKSEKTFSKKEISKIFAKASEIELDEASDEEVREGISKEELLQIGKEVGISTKALEKAINRFEKRTGEDFNWLTGSSELQATVILDEEVTDLQLDQLFPELNAYTGKKGSMEKVGNSYDWEQKGADFESIRRLTIIPKEGKTKIIHYVNWNELRYVGLSLSFVMGGIALIILLKSIGFSELADISLIPIGGIFGYFGFMGFLKYLFNKQKKKFEAILELITDTLERPAQHRIKSDESEVGDNEEPVQKNRARS